MQIWHKIAELSELLWVWWYLSSSAGTGLNRLWGLKNPSPRCWRQLQKKGVHWMNYPGQFTEVLLNNTVNWLNLVTCSVSRMQHKWFNCIERTLPLWFLTSLPKMPVNLAAHSHYPYTWNTFPFVFMLCYNSCPTPKLCPIMPTSPDFVKDSFKSQIVP